jgi:hypothetical protein
LGLGDDLRAELVKQLSDTINTARRLHHDHQIFRAGRRAFGNFQSRSHEL